MCSAPRNAEVPTTLHLSIDHALGRTNLATPNITELQVAVETTPGINYIQALSTMPQSAIPCVAPFSAQWFDKIDLMMIKPLDLVNFAQSKVVGWDSDLLEKIEPLFN